jgi:hypothetical protein
MIKYLAVGICVAHRAGGATIRTVIHDDINGPALGNSDLARVVTKIKTNDRHSLIENECGCQHNKKKNVQQDQKKHVSECQTTNNVPKDWTKIIGKSRNPLSD